MVSRQTGDFDNPLKRAHDYIYHDFCKAGIAYMGVWGYRHSLIRSAGLRTV